MQNPVYKGLSAQFGEILNVFSMTYGQNLDVKELTVRRTDSLGVG